LQLIAAAEAKSSHPLSGTVLAELKARQLTLPDRVEQFENLTGLGVQAVVDGAPILVGTVRLMEKSRVDLEPLQKPLDELLARGQTVMILAVNGKAAAVVGAEDPIKPSAARAVKLLTEQGIEVAMITGCGKRTRKAMRVALSAPLLG
jgi:Cu+-exporting ATPase